MNNPSHEQQRYCEAPLSAPSPAQWQAFWQATLQSAGIISLSAGAIFFLAANWQHMSRWQRFGLFEALFLICAVFAWVKPASNGLGALGLSGLTVLTGVLFGLFGQTFQSGANTYELFFVWAAFSLPYAWLSCQPGLWAFWCVVLNLALALFARSQSQWGFFYDFGYSAIWLILGAVNLALAFAFLARLRSQWLSRFLLLIAVAYMTSGSLGLAFGERSPQFASIVYLSTSVALMLFAWHCKPKDIFPLTLLAINLIVTSTALFARLGDMDGTLMFFALSFWVLASSGAAFAVLLQLHRSWEKTVDTEAKLP